MNADNSNSALTSVSLVPSKALPVLLSKFLPSHGQVVFFAWQLFLPFDQLILQHFEDQIN